MIKAVFFDMDGTLVAYPQEEIPLSARNAIEKLKEKGILVCAATGRHRLELESIDFLGTVSFDAVAALNGQYCYTPQEDLLANAISSRDLAAFLGLQKAKPFPCQVLEKDGMYINYETQAFREDMGKIGSGLPPARSFAGLESREVLQIVPHCSQEVVNAIERVMPSSKAVRWSPFFVDVIPKKGGKTFGIEAILEHFGIGWENVLALGDGENDVEMLKKAEIGVAMGNGAEAVKAAADYVTAEVWPDGVALALEHFGLIP